MNKLDLTLVLDRDWKREINVKNVTNSDGLQTKTAFNYVGYEAKMQIRKKPGHPTALVTLSTADYSLTLSTGQIVILLDRATINASELIEGKYYYDLVITNDEGSFDHIAGVVYVNKNITNVD